MAEGICSSKGTSGDLVGGFKSAARQVPSISAEMLGAITPAFAATRIGAAHDVEERMMKWGERMEPRFISWNAAALHTFDITFPDIWSWKKINAIPSRKPELSAGNCNDVFSPADDKSRSRDVGDAGNGKGVKGSILSDNTGSGVSW